MPNIKSPIGTRTFTSTQQPPSFRTYEVPDESEQYEQEHREPFPVRERNAIPAPPLPQEEVESQFVPQRQFKASGYAQTSSEARKRVELLIGLGRAFKDVKVGEVTFKLRTLKSKETQEALLAAATVPMINSTYEGYKHILAKSIVQIDGNDFSLVIGSERWEDKLEFVENLEDSVFTYLYNQYDILNKENSVKLFPKTEQEVSQAVDEIKK